MHDAHEYNRLRPIGNSYNLANFVHTLSSLYSLCFIDSSHRPNFPPSYLLDARRRNSISRYLARRLSLYQTLLRPFYLLSRFAYPPTMSGAPAQGLSQGVDSPCLSIPFTNS